MHLLFKVIYLYITFREVEAVEDYCYFVVQDSTRRAHWPRSLILLFSPVFRCVCTCACARVCVRVCVESNGADMRLRQRGVGWGSARCWRGSEVRAPNDPTNTTFFSCSLEAASGSCATLGPRESHGGLLSERHCSRPWLFLDSFP